MNVGALIHLGRDLEKNQASLSGEEGFLALVLFLWTVSPVFSFLIYIATGMKLAVDGCGIGFSSILYGFLSVRLYLEYQKAGWTWSMSQELLWYIFAPILTEALEENLSIRHLGHAAGFLSGLVHIAILHVYSSPPCPPRKEKAKRQLVAAEKRLRLNEKTQASRQQPPIQKDQKLGGRGPAMSSRTGEKKRQLPNPKNKLGGCGPKVAPSTEEGKREIQLRAREQRPPIPTPPPSSFQMPPPPSLPIPPPTEASHMEEAPQVASGSGNRDPSTTSDQANDKEAGLADPMDVVKGSTKRKRTNEDEVDKDEAASKISKPS